jgi:hypothetical protein
VAASNAGKQFSLARHDGSAVATCQCSFSTLGILEKCCEGAISSIPSVCSSGAGRVTVVPCPRLSEI